MRLPVFFKWFGSKRKLSSLLPPPIEGPVFEPFAGSAGYSCWNGCQVVHLAERNQRVRELWQWLINEATPDDIRAIPHEQERKVFESRHVMSVGIHGGKLISDFKLTEMQERLVKGATWLPFEHLTSRNVRHPRSTDTSTELVHVSVHMSGQTDSAR
jgi:hypothetical protein